MAGWKGKLPEERLGCCAASDEARYDQDGEIFFLEVRISPTPLPVAPRNRNEPDGFLPRPRRSHPLPLAQLSASKKNKTIKSTPPLDIPALRRDTPGCAATLHLNNAGSSLTPAPVHAARLAYLDTELILGGYEAADAEAGAIAAVYDSIARLLGCSPGEIAACESATRAWQAVFSAVRFTPGDVIMLSEIDYGTTWASAQLAATLFGAAIELLPGTNLHGNIDSAALAARLNDPTLPRVALLVGTHVPTNGGVVQDVETLARCARTAGVPFILDACQTVGQLDLSVAGEYGGNAPCDALIATSRKYLRGPRGAGFLYVREHGPFWHAVPATLDVWSAAMVEEPTCEDDRGAVLESPRYAPKAGARRYEVYERDYGAWVALGAAVDYALNLGL
eukprot:CAMPEP_0174891654 /NCGR_PEP_ID=MMETSP0167-20121228/6713_1 /TAXON_ID=38298 /ORGANISM="Rhodella maculata, Strain CCMP736" /LENGTH=392 /DNA_ID=CAMNT_0016129913 /DNA_START=21 /DNA_END=1197 /DNA_ORIENTATION=+